jgi:hypothetical protein
MPSNQLFTDWATSELITAPKLNQMKNELQIDATRANWATKGTVINVGGMLAWKSYGNNHVIFDASAGTAPDGTAISNTTAVNSWVSSYPTLMGWDGSATYGLRVNSAEKVDSFQVIGTGSWTTSPGLVAGGVESTGNTMTITGAALGDIVLIDSLYTTAARVTAADTITYSTKNWTGVSRVISGNFKIVRMA